MSIPRIYLDRKHWLHLRDVDMGRPREKIQSEIYDKLAQLRIENKAVCPISYSVFSELLRQNDAATRTATAKVIDVFGASCCIQPRHEVFKREVMHFIRRTNSPTTDLYSVAEMVWTKAAFVLGDCFLNFHEQSDVGLAIEKSMDDVPWSMSLEEMISRLPCEDPRDDDPKGFAESLTRGMMSNNHTFNTFEEVFLQEVGGGLEPCYEELDKMMVYFYRQAGFDQEVQNGQVFEGGKRLANLIYNAFKYRRVSIELASVHITSGLHAAIRFDKNRKYKQGDCEDFRHASLALPYFDVFCTDAPLKNLLCHKPLKYDEAYSTQVVATDQEILEALSVIS